MDSDFPKNTLQLLCDDKILHIWNDLHTLDFKVEKNLLVIEQQIDYLLSILPMDHTDDRMQLLYSLIAYVRDIGWGLGQRQLTYRILDIWYKYYPALTVIALSDLVKTNKKYSYGSWRDVPGLCEYIYRKYNSVIHPLIQSAIGLMNRQLSQDWEQYTKTPDTMILSNAAKWVPREGSHNAWLYNSMLLEWSWANRPYILLSANTDEQYKRALNKCKKEYRQIFSSLSKAIGVIEVYQCAGEWDNICPTNVNKLSMQKYWNVLFNQTRDFQILDATDRRRILCGKNFGDYFDNLCLFSRNSFKTKYIYGESNFTLSLSLSCIIRRAIDCAINNCIEETTRINNTWIHLMKTYRIRTFLSDKKHYLPILSCDSCTMSSSFLDAIGYACIFITSSSSGKRILFAGHKPVWINLEYCDDLVSQVKIILEHISPNIGKSNLPDALILLKGALDDIETHYVQYIVLGQTPSLSKDIQTIQKILYHPRYESMHLSF